MNTNILLEGDCFEQMKILPDKSIDLILTDAPYNITNRNRWDQQSIDLAKMWEQFNRIVKDNGVVAMTATMLFAVDLINSNRKNFRYDLVWEKPMPTGFLNCNRMPLRNHELVLIFYKSLPTYHPQKTPGKPYKMTRRCDSTNYGEVKDLHYVSDNQSGDRHPKSVIKFGLDKDKLHPTQKPIALLEWLINSYSNPGDLILDAFAGSGSTGVAAMNTNRRFILIEREQKYIDIIKQRISCVTQSKNIISST